jgi:hypothetical protein
VGIGVMLLSEVAEGVRCVLNERVLTVLDPKMAVLDGART